jgi:hypothetical protein
LLGRFGDNLLSLFEREGTLQRVTVRRAHNRSAASRLRAEQPVRSGWRW